MNNGFLEGMATLVELFGSEKEVNFVLPSHSDAEAIYKDWLRVGNDIRGVAENIKRNNKNKYY